MPPTADVFHRELHSSVKMNNSSSDVFGDELGEVDVWDDETTASFNDRDHKIVNDVSSMPNRSGDPLNFSGNRTLFSCNRQIITTSMIPAKRSGSRNSGSEGEMSDSVKQTCSRSHPALPPMTPRTRQRKLGGLNAHHGPAVIEESPKMKPPSAAERRRQRSEIISFRAGKCGTEVEDEISLLRPILNKHTLETTTTNSDDVFPAVGSSRGLVVSDPSCNHSLSKSSRSLGFYPDSIATASSERDLAINFFATDVQENHDSFVALQQHLETVLDNGEASTHDGCSKSPTNDRKICRRNEGAFETACIVPKASRSEKNKDVQTYTRRRGQSPPSLTGAGISDTGVPLAGGKIRFVRKNRGGDFNAIEGEKDVMSKKSSSEKSTKSSQSKTSRSTSGGSRRSTLPSRSMEISAEVKPTHSAIDVTLKQSRHSSHRSLDFPLSPAQLRRKSLIYGRHDALLTRSSTPNRRKIKYIKRSAAESESALYNVILPSLEF